MTTFNPGDRVRLSDQADAYRRSSVGDSEGTVVEDRHSEIGRTPVNWDNHSMENFPANYEIELVPEPEPEPVHPFAVGDRVEYRNPDRPAHPDNGRTGTVTGQGSYGPQITYDDGSTQLRYPYPRNVRRLDSEESAADKTTQALRERMLDKAIEAAGIADTQYVIDTAKAFEAYVTGGTK